MKKWLISILLLVTIVMTGLFFYAKSFITRDYVVAKLEKSINSRVQVGEISVGFMGNVELKKVLITKRDASAEGKIPHDERDALEAGLIMLESVKLRVSLLDLFAKKASIERISVDGMVADVVLLEDGSSSIEKLFAKPHKAKKKGSGRGSFNARDNDKFVTSIQSAEFKNVDLNVLIEKTQLEIKVTSFYVKMTDIDVNPKKLETINNAHIELGGTFDLKSLDRNLDYGHIAVDGTTQLTIFNNESGDLEPDMTLNLTVGEDSYFTTRIPVIDKLWSVTDQLSKLGINKVRLPKKAELKSNEKVTLAYKLGRVTVLDDFSLHIQDWQAKALSESWFNTGTGLHDSTLKLYVAPDLSKQAMKFLKKSSLVSDLLGKLSGKKSSADPLIEDDKLVLMVKSTGLLSDPKITYMDNFMLPLKGGLEQLLDKDKQDSLEDKIDLLEGLFK